MSKEGNYKDVLIYLLFLIFISLFVHILPKPLSLWTKLQQIQGESDVLKKGKYVTSAACSYYLVTSSWQWGEQAQEEGKQGNN